MVLIIMVLAPFLMTQSIQRPKKSLNTETGDTMQTVAYPEKAIEFYDSVRDEQKELENGKLEWKSTIYNKIDQTDSTLLFIQNALDSAKAYQINQLVLKYLVQEGKLYHQQGNLIKAQSSLEELVTTAEQFGAKRPLCEALYELAEIEQKLGNTLIAVSYASQSEALARELQYNHLLIRIYELQSTLQDQIGDYAMAYYRQELSNQLKDSIYESAQQQQIAEYELAFRIKEKRLSNELLRLEKERQTELSNTRLTITWLLIIFIGLLIVFGISYAQRINLITQEKLRRRLIHDVYDIVGDILDNVKGEAIKAIEFPADEKLVQKQLKVILTLGNKAVNSMRMLIQSIEEKPKTLLTIAEEVQQIAAEQLERGQISFSLNIDGFTTERLLPFDIHHNLLMIYKESIQIMVKYGTKESINIQLIFEKNIISLKVSSIISAEDDAPPFKEEALKSMQNRANKIKGFLEYKRKDELCTIYFYVRVN